MLPCPRAEGPTEQCLGREPGYPDTCCAELAGQRVDSIHGSGLWENPPREGGQGRQVQGTASERRRGQDELPWDPRFLHGIQGEELNIFCHRNE